MTRKQLVDSVGILGYVMLVGGVWMLSPAWSLIVGGGVLLLIGLAAAVKS